jgi:uncharacterized protein
MNSNHISIAANELAVNKNQVQSVAQLLSEGSTIPFIARYRKEATGSLDEVVVASIRDRLNQLEDLDARREAILKSLELHGHLDDELKEKVMAAENMAVLEDIYLPYRPKRRTKAMIAREKGLEPLAEVIFAQTGQKVSEIAEKFIDMEKGVESVGDALAGARDIIAEKINEDEDARSRLRALFNKKGVFSSTVATGMETAGIKYRDYFQWEEPAASAPSHRILAMRRGENEDVLNLSVLPPEEDAINILEALFVKGDGEDSNEVKTAVRDCYFRLLSRSMETELRLSTKERADVEAINVFTSNLRELLLSPPLGPKSVMAIDPGFRTGCKLVCLDKQGKLLHYDTIYPHLSENQKNNAAEKVQKLCIQYGIDAIAVGNGTAGRETETFLKQLDLPNTIQIIMVNESGASVYSASEVARKEFPDLDLTVRGAVSIGRRLSDPLAELVKIDPKAIGVGQYQHDVDQTALKQSLDDVVASCVNGVGVDVNTASAQLLTYVSGLGPVLAGNIIMYRDENGPFRSRQELKKVKRLGPKAFEQSAGFLRIRNGANPLDASAVHPESYCIVDQIASDFNVPVSALIQNHDLTKTIDLSRYVNDHIGMPTLHDIVAELVRPGRDPRETFKAFSFADGVGTIDDLKTGMTVPGIVTNVTAFGAFVDIGVHNDGLVHISELSDEYVKDPYTVVKVHQKVNATVIAVDPERKRISLSLKKDPLRQNNKESKQEKTRDPKKLYLKKNVPSDKKDKKPNRPFNNPFVDMFKN